MKMSAVISSDHTLRYYDAKYLHSRLVFFNKTKCLDNCRTHLSLYLQQARPVSWAFTHPHPAGFLETVPGIVAGILRATTGVAPLLTTKVLHEEMKAGTGHRIPLRNCEC